MATELERLPHLIQRAAAALTKATTAAEVLDAGKQAKAAYVAAKTAAQLHGIKDAHDTVIAACHRVQADALEIEARAQCRLADEYDAAQERGEVQTAGGKRGNQFGIVPNENNASKVEDIGLTRKQVHEARIVRDAEKARPGVIRKTLDQKLRAGEEPTRADVKRATKPKVATNGATPRRTPPKPPERAERDEKVVAYSRGGLSTKDIAVETGAHPRHIDKLLECERHYREGYAAALAGKPHPDGLVLSAKEKFDAALRHHKRELELEHMDRRRVEIRKHIEETLIPTYRKQMEDLERSIRSRKGLMKRENYKKIISCLHPDRVQDAGLKKRFEEAFRLFKELEKLFLDEKESPTAFPTLPKTYGEWMAAKARATANRKAKREAAAARAR